MFGKLFGLLRSAPGTTTRIYPVNPEQGALWHDIAVAAGYIPSFRYTPLADTRMFFFELHVEGEADAYLVRQQMRAVILDRYAQDQSIVIHDNGILTLLKDGVILEGEVQPDGIFVMAPLPPGSPRVFKPALVPSPAFQ